MARKKRIIEQPVSSAAEPKEKVIYQDAFQQNVNRKIDDASRKFEGKGKNLLYGLGALAVLAVLVGIFFAWNYRSSAAAQTALGKAIETSQASVSETPAPAGAPAARTFTTQKARSEAAIAEFQAVADKYSGDVAQKAKYFIAVNRLTLDRAAGIQELENLAKSNDEVGKLSKFALAQAKTDDGKTDEAIAHYNELAGMDNSIISKDTINFQLAKIYEKQGKKQEAVDIYFNIAKTAADAKDFEGKPVTLSQIARDAKERVSALDPEKAKEIPEPQSELPAGM
jgi:tetratricopeptide (TPR) repeat protein